ncbi:MAG: hypothetical protein BAJALOKI2v1_640006 [Promethearchaeota archaeon]|nr:MAG: hypothetical protein BAJALOKI2v1_640006 [Candidatus Lokiarchaeota archaeon]
MRQEIFSRAPVRICDVGGWTDTHFYKGGAVFNISINLYSYIRVKENKKQEVRIISENLKTEEKFQIDAIKYNGKLDLLKAALVRMNINQGLDIFARADVPPGCGTGTSASIAVALIAALSRLKNQSLVNFEIADLAHILETKELGLESGLQDQYAAAYGGINFMKINYPKVKISPVNLNESRILELESQLFLVHLSSRSSSKIHQSVIEKVNKNEKATLHALDRMKNCALKMKRIIHSGTMNQIGKVLNNNWEAQKALHPLMTNTTIERLEEIAFSNGAIGLKCNGAGGGGSFTILADKGKEYHLKETLIKKGYNLLPFKLDFDGVQTWSS